MIAGARRATPSRLRSWFGKAQARALCGLIVPGPDVADAHGLDLPACGFTLAASPREASVLILVGTQSTAMAEAAAVLYAQMMRPRAILAVGCERVAPLPAPDVSVALDPQAFAAGVGTVRRALSDGAFASNALAFDWPGLDAKTEYTCPMHTDVVEPAPGTCPKCGMELVERDASSASHTHDAGHISNSDAAADKHAQRADADKATAPEGASSDDNSSGHADAKAASAKSSVNTSGHDTSHGHEEKSRGGKPDDGPANGASHGGDSGSSETDHTNRGDSGMDHSGMGHSGMDHSGMDHGSGHGGHEDGGFMSMVEMTRDLPRSRDGLPMEHLQVSFGPVFPGLPGGLHLALTLDGDTVAMADIRSRVAGRLAVPEAGVAVGRFVESLARMDPFSPRAYEQLGCRAVEAACQQTPELKTLHARLVALEHERIQSHLGWLAQLGRQTGFTWLRKRASTLQRQWRDAATPQRLQPALTTLIEALRRHVLLRRRLRDLGPTGSNPKLRGPSARAAGCAADTRSHDIVYRALGFETVTRRDGDGWARLQLRLDDIEQSLRLMRRIGPVTAPPPVRFTPASGTGRASVETSRGEARLRVVIRDGQVHEAELDTPTPHAIAALTGLLRGLELGDALTAVCSFDLSPWECSA